MTCTRTEQQTKQNRTTRAVFVHVITAIIDHVVRRLELMRFHWCVQIPPRTCEMLTILRTRPKNVAQCFQTNFSFEFIWVQD